MPPPSAAALLPDQVQQWREEGFLVVHAFGSSGESGESGATSTSAPPGAVLTAREALAYRAAAAAALPRLRLRPEFGGASFPFLERGEEALNGLVLHARVAAACRELLGEEDLVVSQGELWVKQGAEGLPPGMDRAYAAYDQRMHFDYPNHYLTVPPPFSRPDAVAMIVYLDDAGECGGRTAFVPRAGPDDEAYEYPKCLGMMPGTGPFPWINDRTTAEAFLAEAAPEVHAFRAKLYARERYVDYRVGTVLFYRLDVWHRGTPLIPGARRAVVNLVLKKRKAAAHLTSWHLGFARQMYNTFVVPRPVPPQRGRFELLLESLEPEQRELIGFPRRSLGGAPEEGDDQVIQALRVRFPRMRL